MKPLVIIASGQHMVTVLLVSSPAFTLGIICLATSLVLNLMKPKESKKAQAVLVIAGAALLVIAVIAPAFDSLLARIVEGHR
jgi:hypothetical protein